MKQQSLYLGNACALNSDAPAKPHTIPVHHLTTHGIVVGASGTGKTGALIVLLEEAARNGVPTLIVDVKGDMSNLGLLFSDFAAKSVKPWVQKSPGDVRSVQTIAEEQAAERQQALAAWGIGTEELQTFAENVAIRLITPGHTAGEPLHVLSALEHPAQMWQRDPESARSSISAAISLVLRLIGRDPDAARSRDHALLSVLVERRMQLGLPSNLGALLQDLLEPPIAIVGSLPIDSYVSAKARGELAASLNTLLASPTFVNWRQGAPLHIGEWLKPPHERADGKTPMVIVSVAHLDDDDRSLVLGVLLEEVLSWVRSLPGTQDLRALLVFDEVYGFIPPHPAKPPTKQPLMLLLKQGRAFGVGVILATQNPMDIEYRALSNASLWCVARLQTDADRNRVVEAMSEQGGSGSSSSANLSNVLKQLENRWFVMRNLRAKKEGLLLVQPRWAMSYLRGPLTPNELRQVRVRLNGGRPLPELHRVVSPVSGEYPATENTTSTPITSASAE
jgi:hypothetical protein